MHENRRQEDKCCAHPPEQVESGRVNGIGKAASSYEIAAPVENAEEDENIASGFVCLKEFQFISLILEIYGLPGRSGRADQTLARKIISKFPREGRRLFLSMFAGMPLGKVENTDDGSFFRGSIVFRTRKRQWRLIDYGNGFLKKTSVHTCVGRRLQQALRPSQEPLFESAGNAGFRYPDSTISAPKAQGVPII